MTVTHDNPASQADLGEMRPRERRWNNRGSMIIAACCSRVPGALAAAFADKAALKTAVDNCLVAVDTGENCCSSEMADCGAAGNVDMPNWDTSLVTDMSKLFYDCNGGWAYCGSVVFDSRSFNQAIGGWDTSQVTNMEYMFAGAAAFNQDIGSWNTAQVTNMRKMLSKAAAFNQNIGSWNTAQVTNMAGMFDGADAFNQNIGSWNTAQVTNMMYMFNNAAAFNQAIGTWDTSQVTSMSSMFQRAAAFNQNIGSWDTSQVTTMGKMFNEVTAWLARYTNCGNDNSHSACSEFTSFASSAAAIDGPPTAWVRKVNACDAAVPPVNGAAGTCTDTLASGSSCQPECDSGYAVSGASSCLNRVLTSATCTIPCDASTAPTNGAVGTCTSSLASGSTCQPTCNTGYTLSGSRSCSSGTLTDTVACKADSPAPSSALETPEKAAVSNAVGLKGGGHAVLACASALFVIVLGM
jgi:surface protein